MRCKEARRGGSLARDKPILWWLIPCGAAVHRGWAQAWAWTSREAREGSDLREWVGHQRRELPRGHKARRAAAGSERLTPRAGGGESSQRVKP